VTTTRMALVRRRIDLTENGAPETVPLDDAVGTALAATGFVDARPVHGTRLWELRPLSKVGAVAVGDVEVHVAPKVPIDRVVHLLEYSLGSVGWQDATVDLTVAPDLLTAVVEVFERVASRVLRQGVLQGDRTVEETSAVVRGRILHGEQLRRRFGLALPVEVRFDDFTVDTPENRLLRAAVTVGRRLPGLTGGLRHRLARLDLLLDGVTRASPRAALEEWRPTRLNARLVPALRLAEVIVAAASFETAGTGLAVSGFVVDMAKVFEDFVCAALGSALVGRGGGSVQAQDPWALDVAGEVALRPDLVWYTDDDGARGGVGRAGGGRPAAVVDAKYKAEKPSGFPNADVYQMLAYCTRLGLPVGWLVYAKGNEAGATHQVVGAGVEIRARVLDLALPPSALLAQVDDLAAGIVVVEGGRWRAATPSGT